MPIFVANKCVDGYIEPLTLLINISFTEGVFSTELKLARLVPIFKTVDQTEIYLPFTILYVDDTSAKKAETISPI